MIGRTVPVTIDSLGQGGDGVGRFEGAPVYVPLALPGDRLTVCLTARLGDGYGADVVEKRTRTPRHPPVCPHFGACGGCRLQHVPPDDYRAWKRQKVISALASRGIDGVQIRPLIEAEPAGRRRLRLAFSQGGDGRTTLGFRRRSGHDIVPVEVCPIALPSIVNLLIPIRKAIEKLHLAASGGEVAITMAANGPDVLIRAPIPPDLADRETLADLAETEGLARLTWQRNPTSPAEPIAVRRQPLISIGSLTLPLPIGAFLQATDGAETAIRGAVVEAIGGAARIADLFAGCGMLSLPLADKGLSVEGFERDPDMVQAFEIAARTAGIGSKANAFVRDLHREPLQGHDLCRFEALIIDPPRVGARAQIGEIAAGANTIPHRIAMVSCNPATFARDARMLMDAGYRLAWVQPIDAFLYSAEIELVAGFERDIAS